jgi:outer membrane lipoprotein-sorting protein
MFIQIELPGQWLNGRLRDFVKTGSETVNNVRCDVYEHTFDKSKSRRRLWLDPRTGLPIKIASYDVDKAGHETLTQIFDHVQVNIPANATGLSFDPPAGYRTAKALPTAAEDAFFHPVASGSSGDVSLGVWHCFNIDEKALLLCWYCQQRAAGKTATVPPELALGGRPCEHKEIATAYAADQRWNWSLVRPKEAARRIGNDDFALSYRAKKGGVVHLTVQPIRLREERLKAILAEVRRATKTKMSRSAEPFSLDTVRAQLNSR